MLSNEEVLAPLYYILGGTKSGEVNNLKSMNFLVLYQLSSNLMMYYNSTLDY